MPDYRNMYFKLFNKLTNVIEELQQIQQETEELYMHDAKTERTILKIVKDDRSPK